MSISSTAMEKHVATSTLKPTYHMFDISREEAPSAPVCVRKRTCVCAYMWGVWRRVGGLHLGCDQAILADGHVVGNVHHVV